MITAARSVRAIAAVAALGVALTACVGSGDEGATGDEEPTPAAGVVEDEEFAQEDTDATELDVRGVSVNKYALEVGDCFNRYRIVDPETGSLDEIHTTVPCSQPHYGEVYAEAIYPAAGGADWPGDDVVGRWAVEECYKVFEGFVGVAYELSELEIGTVHPTLETWSGEGQHRKNSCYLISVEGNALRGSMRSSAL